MEVINTQQAEQQKAKCHSAIIRNVYVGATLIVVGLLWLLYNFDVLSSSVFDVIFSWRTLLIVIGGFLATQDRIVTGIIVAAIGATALVFDIADIYISADTVLKIFFPALFIIFGSVVLLSKKIRK